MTILMPRELTRSQYFVRWLIFLLAAFIVFGSGLVLMIPLRGHPAAFHRVLMPMAVVEVVSLFAIRICCIDIPRIRNIGWSPWLLLLIFVPLLNLLLQLMLFFTPSKLQVEEQAERTRERAKTVKKESLRDLGNQSGW